jgi:nitrogen fixation protein FixH
MIRELTGRHVLTILIVGFGIVFAVNGLFTWYAIGSFPGIEEDQTYRRGIDFNDQIARSRALQDLGWTMAANLDSDRLLTLRFTDRNGAPLVVEDVSAVLFHPTAERDDLLLDLQPAGRGSLAGSLVDIPKGQRELRISAVGPNGQPIEFRRRLWIE